MSGGTGKGRIERKRSIDNEENNKDEEEKQG